MLQFGNRKVPPLLRVLTGAAARVSGNGIFRFEIFIGCIRQNIDSQGAARVDLVFFSLVYFPCAQVSSSGRSGQLPVTGEVARTIDDACLAGEVDPPKPAPVLIEIGRIDSLINGPDRMVCTESLKSIVRFGEHFLKFFTNRCIETIIATAAVDEDETTTFDVATESGSLRRRQFEGIIPGQKEYRGLCIIVGSRLLEINDLPGERHFPLPFDVLRQICEILRCAIPIFTRSLQFRNQHGAASFG